MNDNKKYEYNSVGNLSVIRDASNNLVATYDYDEMGYRIKKTAYLAAGMKKYTLYIRDQEGNIVTTFEKTASGNTISYSAPTEWNVYGAGRMGILDNTGGQENYIYELSDHLGNVRATFKKTTKTSLSSNFNGGGPDDNWFNNNYNLDASLDPFGVNYSVKTQYPSYSTGAGTKLIPVKNGNSVTLSWKTYFQSATAPQATMRVVLTDASGNPYPNTQQNFAVGGSMNNWTNQSTVINITANYPAMYLQVYPVNNDASGKIAWFDDLGIVFSSGNVEAPDQLNVAAYYPHGSVMPGMNYSSSYAYKYGYQGQFAEMDNESNENFFELRNYNTLLGRFSTIDPYRQFHSPYLAMGNSHPNAIDPDGGNAYTALAGAGIGAAAGAAIALGIDYSKDRKLNRGLGFYSSLIGGGAAVGAVVAGFGWDKSTGRYNLVNQNWQPNFGGLRTSLSVQNPLNVLDPFKQYFAIVVSEASNNYVEAQAIGEVILRTLNFQEGLIHFTDGWIQRAGGKNRFNGYNAPKYKEIMNMSWEMIFSNDNPYSQVIQGAIHAYLIPEDNVSNGAYFWNASSPKKGFNWNKQRSGTFKITASHGRTTFFKYANPGKTYP